MALQLIGIVGDKNLSWLKNASLSFLVIGVLKLVGNFCIDCFINRYPLFVVFRWNWFKQQATFHCEVVTKLWSANFQLFGIDWVMPRKVSDLLGSWRGQLGNRNVLNIWRLAPLYLMWCLWRERNARSFVDCENGLLELKKMMLPTLYIWRVSWHSAFASNFSELELCSSFSMI